MVQLVAATQSPLLLKLFKSPVGSSVNSWLLLPWTHGAKTTAALPLLRSALLLLPLLRVLPGDGDMQDDAPDQSWWVHAPSGRDTNRCAVLPVVHGCTASGIGVQLPLLDGGTTLGNGSPPRVTRAGAPCSIVLPQLRLSHVSPGSNNHESINVVSASCSIQAPPGARAPNGGAIRPHRTIRSTSSIRFLACLLPMKNKSTSRASDMPSSLIFGRNPTIGLRPTTSSMRAPQHNSILDQARNPSKFRRDDRRWGLVVCVFTGVRITPTAHPREAET